MAIQDDEKDTDSTFTTLDNPQGITTVTIDSKHYASVAVANDQGLQIIDISNPDEPSAAGSATDGNNFDTLDDVRSVRITTIGGKTYAVVAANADDGIQIIELQDSTASIEDFAGQRVALYPNPAQTELHLAYTQDTTVSYTVYDLTGRQLATHPARGTAHSLDISSLPTGNYLLQAKHGKAQKSFSFIKKLVKIII